MKNKFLLLIVLLPSLAYSMDWLPASWRSAPTAPVDKDLLLWQAAYAGDEAQIRTLLKEGASPTKVFSAGKISALMAAIQQHKRGAQQVLMDYQILDQVKVKGEFGLSVLHYAAGYKAVQLIAPLVAASDLINNQENDLRATPLHMAISAYDAPNKFETICAVLANGANPMLTNKEGRDATRHAEHRGGDRKKEIIEIINFYLAKRYIQP